ncbi:hypothetical protein LCGC14_0454210 [marine sediment metagenome]|uniref:Uncharacterized protein n=1 Tax=marine sediment metagenome TaxID=412755 RepID=A0A0F9V3V1_9ZZZZ
MFDIERERFFFFGLGLILAIIYYEIKQYYQVKQKIE